MFIIFTLFALAFLLFIVHRLRNQQKESSSKHQEVIPWADGWLPFFGHVFAIKRILPFLEENHRKHGPIFKMQIFRRTFAMVCDNKLAQEYLRSKESELSFFTAFKKNFIGEALGSEGVSSEQVATVFRRVLTSDLAPVIPILESEASILAKTLKSKSMKGEDFFETVKTFVVQTTVKAFISPKAKLTPKAIESLKSFADCVELGVGVNLILPTFLTKALLQRKLNNLRANVIKGLISEIRKYRNNPDLNDSILIRLLCDMKNSNTGSPVSEEEVGNSLVSFLSISMGDISYALINLILDLAIHPEVWRTFRSEARKEQFIPLENRFVHACVMETAKQHAHAMAIQRSPITKMYLGDYYIGDVDFVTLCQPILHQQGSIRNIKDYQPHPDFIPKVTTWGGGTHPCPAKQYAQYVLKITATALVREMEPENFHIMDGFSRQHGRCSVMCDPDLSKVKFNPTASAA